MFFIFSSKECFGFEIMGSTVLNSHAKEGTHVHTKREVTFGQEFIAATEISLAICYVFKLLQSQETCFGDLKIDTH